MFYLDLFSALDTHGVEYVLIGGLAVALHGVERNTMDIDIAVVVTRENLARLVETAKALHLTPVLPVPLSALEDVETLCQWHADRNMEAFGLRVPKMAGVVVDVLLFPPVEPQGMCSRAVILDVSGTPVRLASVDDLIALKQAVGRPIDLADIDHLRRLRKLT
jgi:predicted nucleotidyltransferase